MLQFHPASFDKKNGTLTKRYKGKTLEADMKIHEELSEKKRHNKIDTFRH